MNLYVEDVALTLYRNWQPNRPIFSRMNFFDQKMLRNILKNGKFLSEKSNNTPRTDITPRLTQKQRDLILKLIYKYRIQIEMSGFAAGKIIADPIWKSSLRPEVQYKEELTFDKNTNTFNLSFSYNHYIISGLRYMYKSNRIHIAWNNIDNVWNFQNSDISREIINKIINQFGTFIISEDAQKELDNGYVNF